MKKLFALVALVLGVVSCQTDPNDLDVVVGGEREVMLNVSLPEATRANSANGFQIADLGDNYDLRYILEVYRVDDEDNILYEKCQRQVKCADAATMSFPVRLAPGYNYQIVAWADIVDNGSEEDRIYKTDNGLDAIEIISWNAMDETRDAYTGTKYIADFSSASNLSMELTRPFAKVRVVATDINDITALGLSPKAAKVSYLQNMYTKYNAATAEASAAEAKSHTYTTFPYTDATGEMTLFADYVFVPESGTAKFSLNVYDDEAAQRLIKENSFSTEIFVERNKITTIKGDVLTEGGNVSVKVENDLGEIVTIGVVDTADKLRDAINRGVANIILEGDDTIMFDEPVSIPAGVTTTIDLNGKTITGGKQTDPTKSIYAIENHGTLTLKNGTINARGVGNYGTLIVEDGVYNAIDTNGGGAIWNYTGSNVTINGGTFTGAHTETSPAATTLHVADGATAVVNGGTFENDANLTYAIISYGDLTVNDATVIGEHGAIAASAGTLTINGGYYEVTGTSTDHVIYAPNGGVTINNGTFNLSQTNASSLGSTIIDGAVDVKGGTFDSVNGAFAYNGEAGLVVSGGTFKNKAITVYGGDFAQFVADGYSVVDNGNEIYTVVNLKASEVEIYGLTLKPDGNNSKIIVNDKEGFLNLTKLFNDWTALFTDGNGTTYTNYANGAGVDYYYAGRWTVSLEADIDLNNATISPIIIKHPVSTGSPAFEGNDHTIKNAVIVTDPATENEAGLFVSSPCGFNNLKLDNIHVTGSNVGNSTAGVLAGSNRVGIDNITITNSSVEGGKYTGGVIGYGYTDITNCTLTTVSVKGGYKLGGLIGYICASGANTGEVTGNTLTDCSVDGIGGGIYAGGKSEYIIGMLVGNYNCDGTCKDNVVYGITTTATKVIGKIEAGKVVNESNNIVTYVVENNGELNTALTKGGKIELANGNYTMPEPDLRDKTITITGTRDVVIDATAVSANDQFVTGATMVFDGVTINFGTTFYMGFANTASLTYKNCKINGLQFLYGANVTFENCEFDSNGAEHSVWTYGCKNITFTECDFTYGDRGVNCYCDNDVAGGQTVNFTKCNFTSTNTASAGAVEINSTYITGGIVVNLDGCTAPAYGELAYVSPWDSTNGAKTTINIQ